MYGNNTINLDEHFQEYSALWILNFVLVNFYLTLFYRRNKLKLATTFNYINKFDRHYILVQKHGENAYLHICEYDCDATNRNAGKQSVRALPICSFNQTN